MTWIPIVAQEFGPGALTTLLDADVVPRGCRFCGKQEGTVTFRREAHAIPTAIGNREVLSRGECDGCNERFGATVENDLVNFIGPIRTISGIRARSGVPTFRRRPSSAPIRHGGGRLVLMNEPGNDDALLVRDGTEGTNLEVEVEYPPFDLENVGRAIARMALFHLPAGPGSSLRHVLEWVRGDVSWQPAIYEVLLPGGVTPNGVFMTLEPSPEYKSHTLLACLVCSCVAYFVPFPSTDWTVIEPPWQIVLEPFSVFAGSLEINRFPSQLGRIHGLRRTLHMKQAEGSEKPQR